MPHSSMALGYVQTECIDRCRGERSGNPSPQIGSETLREMRLRLAALSQFIRVTVVPLAVSVTTAPLR